MAKVQGVKEKLHSPIYDAFFVSDKDTQKRRFEEFMTDPRVIRFFVDVQNKTKLETNMQAAGALPSLNTFETRALRVVASTFCVPGRGVQHLPAQHFLCTYREAIGNDIRSIAPETIALLIEHDWPGNVRELANAVEHAVIVEKGPAILPSSLPMNLIESRDGTETPETSSDLGLREKLNLLEKEILLDTLLRANGIKKQAAAMLGIDPRNMPYLLRKHQLRDGLRSN